MPSGITYGIDFGAWNCALAVRWPDGTTTLARDPHAEAGISTIPSSVCVDSDGTLVVGYRAERLKAIRPSGYLRGVKKMFGRDAPISLGGRRFAADELVTEILRFMRESAEALVREPPDRVVITVPVSWEGKRRALMLKAAGAAGLQPSVVRLEPEPVAALAHIFADHPGTPEMVLVYDFGGATFDCAVAVGGRAGYQVLGGPASAAVGGMDIDQRLVELVRKRFPDETAALFDSGAAANPAMLARRRGLVETCERLKCQLSERASAFAPQAGFDLRLTRADLDEVARPFVEQTIEATENLLTSAAINLTWNDIDEVVAVGGSSRLTAVGTMFAEASVHPKLGGEPRPTLRQASDLDTAVVRGAALLARPPWSARVEHHPKTLTLAGDSTLIVTGEDGYLTAVDAFSGKPSWSCPPAPRGDAVRLVAETGDGGIAVIHDSGRIRLVDNGSAVELSIRIHPAEDSEPVVGYGLLFYSGDDGELHAVDLRAGSQRWSRPLDGRIAGALVPALGMLFAATSAGQIIAVDAATGRGPAPEPLDDSSFEITEHRSNGQIVIRAPARTPLTGPFMVARVTHQVGEQVAAGDLLMHLRSGSLTIDVLSPIAGTLCELPHRLADWVPPGDPVVLITPPAHARKG